MGGKEEREREKTGRGRKREGPSFPLANPGSATVVRRFNSVWLHDGYIDDDRSEYGALQYSLYFFCRFDPPEIIPWLK